MSSSQPSTTDREVVAAPVRPAFNWIEVCAIPIAANIMETQPIVLLLFFCAVAFAGAGTPLPLGEAGITLLLLGLQWWAMFINDRLRRGMEQRTASILHVSGVVFAFGLALLTNLTTFDLPMIVVIAGLVIFCWKRGIDKAKDRLYDEQLIFVFKLGMGILLAVLVLSVLSPGGPLQDVATTLGYALPLFFLSGLIALSFTRVSIIRREHVRQGISQANSTRGWLVALTFLWGVMVVGALMLETFSFGLIQKMLLPLWNILAIIVDWIIYAVFWVMLVILQFFDRLFHFQLKAEKMPRAAAPQQNANSKISPVMEHFPAWLMLIGRLFLLAVVLIALIAIFRVILLHARQRLEQDSEEEIREALSMRSILRERRRERTSEARKKEETLLDELDPRSVRARYRELLQQMAEHGGHLSRRAEETPMEYQNRLLVLLARSSDDIRQDDEVPDREMLVDLTRAYIDERYGKKQAELQPLDGPGWISRMAERLGGRGA